jgi:hypothetical protein
MKENEKLREVVNNTIPKIKNNLSKFLNVDEDELLVDNLLLSIQENAPHIILLDRNYDIDKITIFEWCNDMMMKFLDGSLRAHILQARLFDVIKKMFDLDENVSISFCQVKEKAWCIAICKEKDKKKCDFVAFLHSDEAGRLEIVNLLNK